MRIYSAIAFPDPARKPGYNQTSVIKRALDKQPDCAGQFPRESNHYTEKSLVPSVSGNREQVYKDAVKKNEDGHRSADVVTFTSTDNAYQTGVYRSGPLHDEIKGPQGLPYNEFLYFLSGGVKLTYPQEAKK